MQEKCPSTSSKYSISNLEINERNAIIAGYFCYHLVILSDSANDFSQTCYILYEQCVNAIVHETVSVENETVSVNTTGEVVLPVVSVQGLWYWLGYRRRRGQKNALLGCMVGRICEH